MSFFNLRYANVRKRENGKMIFSWILSKENQKRYSIRNNIQNAKGADQWFLYDIVWPVAKANATVHDSYLCNQFGGEPFPTQRPNDKFCFAACFLPCCDTSLNQTNRMPECPMECRPKEHQDWYYC